jgi:5-formyltetrahydrofolate cyclo-ligase
MTKAEGRRRFRALRKALSAEEVEARSQQISQHLFEQGWVYNVMIIHTFLPILRQNEVNTWSIIHRIWRDFPQIRVAVSITNNETYQLTHYQLTPDTLLGQNQWGIPEPIAEKSYLVHTQEIDLVLVPLLIFDQNGHRVGYGGGFYDRFLADCRPDCLKVGLSLFEPIEAINDIIATDIPLDVGLTPEGVYVFD